MATTPDRRVQLSIDVSRAVWRRTQVAAARRGQSIGDYIRQAVEARLAQDLGRDSSAADLTAITERTDAVLAALWDNPRDAEYDKQAGPSRPGKPAPRRRA